MGNIIYGILLVEKRKKINYGKLLKRWKISISKWIWCLVFSVVSFDIYFNLYFFRNLCYFRVIIVVNS